MQSEDSKNGNATMESSFSVNRRSETIVSANSSYDAKKLVEAQYAGQRVSFINVTRA